VTGFLPETKDSSINERLYCFNLNNHRSDAYRNDALTIFQKEKGITLPDVIKNWLCMNTSNVRTKFYLNANDFLGFLGRNHFAIDTKVREEVLLQAIKEIKPLYDHPGCNTFPPEKIFKNQFARNADGTSDKIIIKAHVIDDFDLDLMTADKKLLDPNMDPIDKQQYYFLRDLAFALEYETSFMRMIANYAGKGEMKPTDQFPGIIKNKWSNAADKYQQLGNCPNVKDSLISKRINRINFVGLWVDPDALTEDNNPFAVASQHQDDKESTRPINEVGIREAWSK
jgi:hypothetical protein